MNASFPGIFIFFVRFHIICPCFVCSVSIALCYDSFIFILRDLCVVNARGICVPEWFCQEMANVRWCSLVIDLRDEHLDSWVRFGFQWG